MNQFIYMIALVTVLSLTASSAFSRGAGSEWEKLNQEVLSLYQNGKYEHATAIARKALEVAEQNAGPDHLDVATSLNNLAGLYRAQGQYAQAEPLYKRSLAIIEKVLGPGHPDVATCLNNLAGLHGAQGQHAAAEPLLKRALAISEKVLGPDHPDVADSLHNLAALHWHQGQHAQAEPLYKRALAIREKALGPDHPDVANSLNDLARLHRWQGQYAQAEPLSKRALAIREKALGPDHPDVAASLNNFAELYKAQGQYAQAEPLHKRALAIREKALGPDHPDVAASLNNLAGLHCAQGQYAQAEPLLKRSLAIYEKALGPDHPDVANSLNNLAELYKAQGQHDQAELLLKRSLAIWEKALGPDHPDVANSLNNLAGLHWAQGQYAQAEPLLKRSLAIHEKALGPNHPDVANSLNNLTALYHSQGQYAQAEPLMKRALVITRRSLKLTAEVQSEQRQLAMAENRRGYLDGYLSLVLQAKLPATGAYAEVLAWKGAVTARQSFSRLARGTHDPEIVRTLDELQTTATRLATLTFAVPEPKNRETWQRQVAELSQRRDDLESELSRRSAEFRHHKVQQQRTSDDVRHVLPAGTALIDTLVFTHSRPPEGGRGKFVTERRLAAFVVRSDRPVELFDLGPVEPVVEAIAAWRAHLSAQAGPAVELRRLVWDKLEPALDGASTVLISPDGPLAYFPWCALPGKQPGTYLIEERTLAVVPVPQMLPELMEARPGADGASLLLVGGVDYDDALAPKAQPEELAAGRFAPRGGGTTWAALPGTAAEVDSIKDTFVKHHRASGLRELRGGAAREEQVRSDIPRNRFLHFATHGFFAPPEVRSALAGNRRPEMFGQFDRQQQQVIGYNPQLLSGLVLAGANRPPEPGRDDGILTALEVGELDLSGVDLATLSACETGLGQTAGGEGMLGLQRAFQVAGCRNVVASLWKVDDAATAALMKVFYHKLWQENKPPIEALREAQLAILRHPEQIGELARTRGPDFEKTVKLVDQGRVADAAKTAPPRLWAAFVISGAPQLNPQKPSK